MTAREEPVLHPVRRDQALQLFQQHVRRCLAISNTVVIAQDDAIPAVRIETLVDDKPLRNLRPGYPAWLAFIDIWVDPDNEVCEDRVATRDAPYGWV